MIHAPNHPNKYFIDYCYEWSIRSSHAGSRVMLVIENFILEGSQGASRLALTRRHVDVVVSLLVD